MSNPELAVVLDFLFAAKLEPADAFAAAKSLLEAGIKTREDLASLTPARAKELTVPKIHRKVLAALRKMPTLDGSSVLDEATSPKKRQAAALPPPPPEDNDSGLPDVVINRSPVMILWAAACAFSSGDYDWGESLSLGSACAALFARTKGKSLGLYSGEGGTNSSSSFATFEVKLLGAQVPAHRTAEGAARGLSQNRNDESLWDVAHPAAVHRSLSSSFGKAFGSAWHAMLKLARSVPASSLNAESFDLYARFRPEVPAGLAGWGQPGRLQLSKLEELWCSYGGGNSSSSADASSRADESKASSFDSRLASSTQVAPPQLTSPVKKEPSQTQRSEAITSGTSGEVGPVDETAIRDRLFAEITRQEGTGGATQEQLSSALCEAFGPAAASAVSEWVEALQMDGAVYEREGRYLPL